VWPVAILPMGCNGACSPTLFPHESIMTTKIRYYVSQPFLSGREEDYLLDALDKNQLTQGPYIEAFEQKFAHACGMNHGVACSNGTTALHLALLALGVGPGDEVLVPTLTYIAAVNAIAYCGATPVLCDADPDTWCISPADIELHLTPRTKGILAVHVYGHLADMDTINAIAGVRDLWVLEDAAEAHGARYKNRPAGSLGHVSAFSFYGNKIITTGEGGMVLTNHPNILKRLRLYRGQGQDPERRFYHPVRGYNYRMTNLQAAIGLGQTENIRKHVDARRSVDAAYRMYLTAPEITFQRIHDNADPSGWLTTVLVPPGSRDALAGALLEDGIETRPAFIGAHHMPMYAKQKTTFPIADKITACGLSLPTHAGLTMDDVRFISRCVLKFFGHVS
jgi:perosamine synthetase